MLQNYNKLQEIEKDASTSILSKFKHFTSSKTSPSCLRHPNSHTPNHPNYLFLSVNPPAAPAIAPGIASFGATLNKARILPPGSCP